MYLYIEAKRYWVKLLLTHYFVGKKRGRPRRSEQSPKYKPPDKIDSAAEGLLELSNTGHNSVWILSFDCEKCISVTHLLDIFLSVIFWKSDPKWPLCKFFNSHFNVSLASLFILGNLTRKIAWTRIVLWFPQGNVCWNLRNEISLYKMFSSIWSLVSNLFKLQFHTSLI